MLQQCSLPRDAGSFQAEGDAPLRLAGTTRSLVAARRSSGNFDPSGGNAAAAAVASSDVAKLDGMVQLYVQLCLIYPELPRDLHVPTYQRDAPPQYWFLGPKMLDAHRPVDVPVHLKQAVMKKLRALIYM
jgi:hypothetical protein